MRFCMPIFGTIILFSAFVSASGSIACRVFAGSLDTGMLNAVVESGYKSIDNQIKTFAIGTEKTKVKFLASVGEDEPKSGSPKQRGTVRLRFKAKNLREAVNLIGQIVDMYLHEPPITRDSTFTPIWDPDVSRRVELQDYNGEYAEFTDGALKHSSRWDTRVSMIYSGKPNINAGIDHGWAVDIAEPGYSGLDIAEDDIVVTVRTHPGRNESLNSERLFRSLFNFGKPE